MLIGVNIYSLCKIGRVSNKNPYIERGVMRVGGNTSSSGIVRIEVYGPKIEV